MNRALTIGVISVQPRCLLTLTSISNTDYAYSTGGVWLGTELLKRGVISSYSQEVHRHYSVTLIVSVTQQSGNRNLL